jgi:hypothetical protein
MAAAQMILMTGSSGLVPDYHRSDTSESANAAEFGHAPMIAPVQAEVKPLHLAAPARGDTTDETNCHGMGSLSGSDPFAGGR